MIARARNFWPNTLVRPDGLRVVAEAADSGRVEGSSLSLGLEGVDVLFAPEELVTAASSFCAWAN